MALTGWHRINRKVNYNDLTYKYKMDLTRDFGYFAAPNKLIKDIRISAILFSDP